MTAFASTETHVNLRHGSASAAEHPRFTDTGPLRVIDAREVPSTYEGPFVKRVLLESEVEPGERIWANADDLEEVPTS